MRESRQSWHPDVINRWVFRDVTDTASYGVNTSVTITNGVAVFNGTTSKLTFTPVKYNNVNTIRLKITKLNSLTQDICKLSSTKSISINAGTIVATGFTTPRIYINGKLTSTITASGGDLFIVQDTAFTINDFVLGYSTGYFSGEIDLVEIYNKALVEGMVDAIQNGRYFKEHPADLQLVKEMAELGYIWVPGNTIYSGCENGFWVAKYQMKASKTGFRGKGRLVSEYPGLTQTYNTWYYSEDSSITPVSSASGSPISMISQTTSISVCSALTTSFRKLPRLKLATAQLINNNHWMTLARNIEQVTSNWSGGEVGSGYIYSGHNDGTPNAALVADTNDNNGYYLTGQTSGNQRRTLTLTNGEVIWDLSGNVWEWTNNTIQRKDQPDGYLNSTDEAYTGGWNYEDYSKASGGTYYLNSSNLGSTTLTYNDLFLLGSSSYTATTNGIGRIYTYSNSADADTTVDGFLRGGSWGYGTVAGLLALALSYVPGGADVLIGLRCVVVP